MSDTGVNWEAYSHEELYEMLWQDADVADVSMIATEWARHRAALDTHAEVLREQRAALLDGWQGAAAEETAARLDTLATRVEKISELAHAGQQAAQEAADALAMARAMMPAPPGRLGAPFTDAAAQLASGTGGFSAEPFAAGAVAPFTDASAGGARLAGFSAESVAPAAPSLPAMALPPVPPVPSPPPVPDAPAVPSSPGLSFAAVPTFSSSSFAPDYAEMFTPAPANPGMGTAFGAVGSAGYSFYFGAASADQQKAQAVRAMQTYESSLTGSSRMIDEARGAIPPAAPTVRAAGPGGGGGVPWASLVDAGPVRGVTAGPVRVPAAGSVIGGPGGAATPLGLGPRFGALPGVPAMPGAQLAAETAAARAAAHNGLVPPVGGQRGGAEEERHENQLPTIDHELFTVEVPTSPAVIGDTTGGRL